jgi:hypothetical protein
MFDPNLVLNVGFLERREYRSKHLLMRFMICSCLLLRRSTLSELNYSMKKIKQYINCTLSSVHPLFPREDAANYIT